MKYKYFMTCFRKRTGLHFSAAKYLAMAIWVLFFSGTASLSCSVALRVMGQKGSSFHTVIEHPVIV